MDWNKIDEMFPYGGIYTNQGFLSNQVILNSNLEKIESLWETYARDMVTQKEKIVYFSNGDMLRFYEYNIYPKNQIEGQSTLNDFGQKILNDAIERKANELFK